MSDGLDQLYEHLLVARCQAGDVGAFTEIVSRYQRRLTYFLRKSFGAPAVVDDLLQDVWMDVFRSLPKLRDPAAFPAWVYRIARDRAYRELRRSTKWTSIELEPEIEVSVVEASDTFANEDARLVHECLDELTPPHREVLVLRFLESLSYEAIADIVGCGVGTVRSRLHYAKLALRAAIERKRHR